MYFIEILLAFMVIWYIVMPAILYLFFKFLTIYKSKMIKKYLNKIKEEKYNVISFLFFVLGIWLILMGSLWGLSLFL